MILLIGLTLGFGGAIAIYFLRQWLLTFRPQTESCSSSLSKPPGYTALLSALFYVFILPLSYLELLWEAYREGQSQPIYKPNSKMGSDSQKISRY
jgi:hypothetical protein